MPQFHETGYGRTFYEGQLPRLIRALERIADSLDKPTPTPGPTGLDTYRAAVEPLLGDAAQSYAALDAIQAALSGQDWTPDTLDTVARILRGTGRTIADKE